MLGSRYQDTLDVRDIESDTRCSVHLNSVSGFMGMGRIMRTRPSLSELALSRPRSNRVKGLMACAYDWGEGWRVVLASKRVELDSTGLLNTQNVEVTARRGSRQKRGPR